MVGSHLRAVHTQGVGQFYERSDVRFILPLGDVTIGQLGDPLVDVGRIQLIQTCLGFLQVAIQGVGRCHQDDVLLLVIRLQVGDNRVVVPDGPDDPAQQKAQSCTNR